MRPRVIRSFALVGALLIALTASAGQPALAAKTATPSVQFARVTLSGAAPGIAADGSSLRLASRGLASGTYNDAYGYGAIAEEYATWTSPLQTVPFTFDELVASWNATTPTDTWVSIEMRATAGTYSTKWYTMGVWASGDSAIHRTSIGGQGDVDGYVAIDTFVRDNKAPSFNSYRLRVGLHRRAGSAATPVVTFLGAMTSAASTYDIPSTFGLGREVDLAVPQYSQEIHAGQFPEYDGGGEAWCSPTSTAMVLDYWGVGPTPAEIAAGWPAASVYADPQVDWAARHVYDWHYQGAGNWPFNAAYAASRGVNAFVTRLRSLTEAERFIAAGIPLVASIQGKLPGFFFKKTSGHLLVIRGFTASGDVIANDPAVPDDSQVRKVYGRADFEKVWLGGSSGIVYVIHPSGTVLPANTGGNW